ncbi:MAG: DNA topoisomerase 3 [Lachnospiraceae bacterium]|nr:DNA topoisomerase 3 [Lachnospiraceae bacterium]
MELVITEKPSVAQSLAKVIGADERHDGYLKGNGYIVSWCVGHLIELSQPEAYDMSLKIWRYETLPILPDTWKYEVKKDTKKQFHILKDLMLEKRESPVSAVICATDAGREGELIFRLVYEQAGCKKPVKRLWISSMEESAIREGFNSLRAGKEYDNLYRSALCRQQADWIVGLNGTRLFTVLYKSKVLKVGRVQTPTLAMLVDREIAIRNFRKTPFYTVHLLSGGIDGISEKYPDRSTAERVAKVCVGEDAIVEKITSEEKSVSSPKLYDLTSLQRDANRIFGFTARKTLEYTQSLYEKKLCTYPRTDSRYLSDDMEETANRVLEAAESAFPYLRETDTWMPDLKRIMNSKKVSDHHAIIPTVEIGKMDKEEISEGETKILSLISARLKAAVSKRYRYRSVKAEIMCSGYSFTATGRTILEEGWKRYERLLYRQYRVKAEKEEESSDPLPDMKEDMVLFDVETKVTEGFTKPPAHFTEDSLLQAMEKAGAEDMDDDVERKGLGTPATRADIIEKLVRDGFVKREKKQMIPTEDGEKLITILPETVKSPKLTADWENALSLVAKGEYSADRFMDGIRKMMTDLVKTYHEVGEENKKMFGSKYAIGSCPKCGEDVLKGKFGIYCSGKCGMTIGRAYGKELTEDEVRSILEGKKTLVTGLKSKKGGTYDAYLTPERIEPYSYTRKNGGQVSGFQFAFKMEFPNKKDKEDNKHE